MAGELRLDYDSRNFEPPAAAIHVELRSPARPRDTNPEVVLALIDTGADGSVVPVGIVGTLGLKAVGEVKVGGYDDDEDEFVVRVEYSVHVSVPPLAPMVARVTTRPGERHALIGRDIINEWLVTLDGPRLQGVIEEE